MDFLDSLFDFNGDGKVDWMDHAQAAAICAMADEDEAEEGEELDDGEYGDDELDAGLGDGDIDAGMCFCPECFADFADQDGFAAGEDWTCEECGCEVYYDWEQETYVAYD